MSHLCPEVVAFKSSSAGPAGSASAKGKERATNQPPEDFASAAAGKKEETQLGKAIKDSNKVAMECQHGLLSQSALPFSSLLLPCVKLALTISALSLVLKDTVFNLNKGRSAGIDTT